MKNIKPDNFDSMLKKFNKNLSSKEKTRKRVSAIYDMLSDILGADKLILKAGKLEALKLLRSQEMEERILGLQKVVYEDPTLEDLPETEEIPEILEEIEEEIADLLARKSLEDSLQAKINIKMQEKHDEYMQDLKKQILTEQEGAENAQTLKKLAVLEKKEKVRLSRSIMEVLRPSTLEEIVGQSSAVKSLLSKLAAPYPQHIILYGPPGVGKTTAARLALQAAKKLSYTPFEGDAPFEEVDATTLRWDPREATNPLTGSVHDPIYQGARRELVEGGIPEPKPGLVTDAHGGVLFIDEIGEMDIHLQSKLLKVLEDKRIFFDSAYYDPSDDNIPQYIKKLFEQGAPADFILIGATTRSPSKMSPALRSRCTEVYFEPLSSEDIQKIIVGAAKKLNVELVPQVPGIISEYTIEGRKAINILADAYGLALFEQAGGEAEPGDTAVRISEEEVFKVIQTARLAPYVSVKAGEEEQAGRIFGLGSFGYIGVVLEIEAAIFPSLNGKGSIRFNDTAGSMARDSVFNAVTAIKRFTGKDLNEYDLHVNVIGGGNIEGPSAGAAMLAAMYSALQNQPIRTDLAVSGEISLQGKIKPVGGIQEKIYGAKQAGIKKIFVPEANLRDIYASFSEIEVIGVSTARELLELLFQLKITD